MGVILNLGYNIAVIWNIPNNVNKDKFSVYVPLNKCPQILYIIRILRSEKLTFAQTVSEIFIHYNVS